MNKLHNSWPQSKNKDTQSARILLDHCWISSFFPLFPLLPWDLTVLFPLFPLLPWNLRVLFPLFLFHPGINSLILAFLHTDYHGEQGWHAWGGLLSFPEETVGSVKLQQQKYVKHIILHQFHQKTINRIGHFMRMKDQLLLTALNQEMIWLQNQKRSKRVIQKQKTMVD